MHDNFRKKMGKHMRQRKNNLLLIEQEVEEILANTAPDKSHSDILFDTADNIFGNDDPADVDSVSFSVEANRMWI